MTPTMASAKKRKIRPRLFDFIQQVILFVVTFTAFAAGVVALLSYFGLLPSAFLPLVYWIEHFAIHR